MLVPDPPSLTEMKAGNRNNSRIVIKLSFLHESNGRKLRREINFLITYLCFLFTFFSLVSVRILWSEIGASKPKDTTTQSSRDWVKELYIYHFGTPQLAHISHLPSKQLLTRCIKWWKKNTVEIFRLVYVINLSREHGHSNRSSYHPSISDCCRAKTIKMKEQLHCAINRPSR